MSNQIRGFVKLVFTPAGGGDPVTFTGRSGKITNNDQLVDITEIDETNHQIYIADQEIIRGETTFEVLEVTAITKALVDALFGNNSTHAIGLSRARGTATLEWHDRKDAVSTPFLALASFTCRVEVQGLEIGIEETKAAAINVITEGTTRPTYKVRGVPA